jgi:uncharacterized protein
MVASTLREPSAVRRQSAAPLEESAERLGSGEASLPQSSGDDGAVIRSAMAKPGIDPNVPQAISLTGGGVAYTQNFDTLSNVAGSTTNPLTIPDWVMNETGGGTRDNEQYAVDTGGSNTGDTYSYGSAGSTDRALGSLQSGTLISSFGAFFTNNTGATITELQIAYTGEQWRIQNTAAARDDRLDFQYSLNATSLTTGTWTDVNALDFVNPIKTAGAATALDGNAAANRTAISGSITGLSIAPGATFWIRWNDLNASGADDGLAIDDFSLTAITAPVTPTLNINDVTAAEGDNGATVFTFTVSLTAPAGPGGVTFDIETGDGTAQSGTDFVFRSASFQTIPAGASSYTFDVTVNGDRSIEGNETFFVNVTNVTGANVGDAQGQGTITNDDAGGAFSVGDVTVDEAAGTATITISRTGGAADATISYATQDGTASAGQDYGATSGNLAFTNGEASRTFTVSIIDDGDLDPGESFSVVISNPSAGTIADDMGVVAITDNENPGALAIGDVSMAEGNAGTTAFTFTVTRSGGSAGAVGATWTLTLGGSADAADFGGAQATSGTVSFAAGSNTPQTVTILVQGDLAIESDETFSVVLSNPTGGATIADASGAGTIQNDDFPPTVSIADAASVFEGNEGVTYLSFNVSLSAPATGPTSVDFATSGGTATPGSDYLAVSGTVSFAAGQTSKTVRVPVIGDRVPEPSETVGVTLSNPVGLTIADGSASGTILDEGGAAYFPLATGPFSQDWSNTGLITTNDDWSGVPFIVGYLGDGVTDGTGADPQTLTGSTSTVDVIAQAVTTSTSGGVGEFQLADPTIGLQGSGTADAPYIVLFLDSTGRQDVTVSYRLRDIDGTADNAVQPVALQYRIGDSGSWTNVPAGFVADATTGPSTLGPDTMVTATLPAAANNQSQLQVRIITANAAGNDEWVGVDDIVVTSSTGPATYSVADGVGFEGDSGPVTFTFNVTRNGDANAAGSVDYQVNFGGPFPANAADFDAGSPLSGTVSFQPGEFAKTITIQVAGDVDPEADESFFVTLSNPVNGAIADGSALGTIVNDDAEPPLVEIGDIIQSETNGATTFTFTVFRSGGTGAFSVDYATADGTAVAGQDYQATSGTLNFAAGENSKTISVTVTGDTAAELVESFSVQLSNPTNFAVLAAGSGAGVIQNDDIFFIHDIQGTAYYSPILAAEGLTALNEPSLTRVVVRAVVTAVDNDGQRQGFYLTEELADWDANPFTSEGIFVMTRDDFGNGVAVAGVAVGDIVTITANVVEYQAFNTLPRTMLVGPSNLIVNSSGNALPTLLLDASFNIPSAILTGVTPDYSDSQDGAGDTFDASLYALSFWETVEGMLVTIPDMVVADGFVSTSGGQPIFQAYSRTHADADQINSRGGYTIAGDPPLSPPDTADAEDGTTAGGRHLHDGDTNPDIIEIDFSGFAIDAFPGLATAASMGDRLGDVTGIVEFDFTDRKLFVTNIDAGAFVDSTPSRETTALGNDSRSLTVATFNVENLDPGDGAARFQALADAIANNLNAPDIISIEEIQDNNGATNDGTTDASTTWQMLVDALNALVPGAAYQWVDQAPVNNAEGGQGGGNIRVGFLYNTTRVQLGDLPANASLADRRKYTDRIGDGVRDAGDLIAFSDNMIAGEINPGDWSATRLSLLGQFTFNGNTVFVTANHFTAKGGSGDFWQFDQNLAAGEPENAGWSKRVAQANDVYTMLNHIQQNAASPVGIVAGGDFNDFYFYRPLEVLTGHVLPDGTARSGGARFDNLTLTLPEAERYTYTFDGRSQAIDHVIANGLLSGVATYDVVHLNTGFNPTGSPRLSDHDPAVASFDFRSFAEVLSGSAGNDISDGEGGNDQFLLQQGGDDRALGGFGDDGFFLGGAFGPGDAIDGGAGEGDQLALRGGYSGLVITGAMLTNVETVALLSGGDTSFGGPGGLSHDYGLAADDSLLGAGGVLTFNANGLQAGEDFTFNGSAESDGAFRFFGGMGTENLTGGAMNDGFFFGGTRFDVAADKVDGFAGDDDQLGLRGDFNTQLVFLSDTIRNIDTIALISSQDATYGVEAGPFRYNIRTHNDNVAAGATLTVNGNNLRSNETLTFDGSNETDGAFRLFGGAAFDTLTGGSGADLIFGNLGADSLTGGGGADTFVYLSSADSTSAARDGIQDFNLGDLIDLSRIDADGNAGNGDTAFSFIGNAAFSNQAGQLRFENVAGPIWLIQGDTDGNGVSDLEIILVVNDADPITTTDFIL